MATEARLEFTDFIRIAPDARAALSALSKAVDDSGLEKQLVELIKIRASQITAAPSVCSFISSQHARQQYRNSSSTW